MTTLGSISSNGLQTAATGISTDGSTVVGWGALRTGGTNQVHAILWGAGGNATDLGTIGGIVGSSQATATNQNGAVVVGESNYNGSTNPTDVHAFRWTAAGGMSDLGTIGNITGVSQALAVNADGSIVVGWSQTATSPGHAFVWSGSGGMQDLNTMLANAGVNMNGITLISAHGVSADGSFVVGDETLTALGNNTTHAFIARIGGGSAGLTTPQSIIASIQELGDGMLAQTINDQLLADVLLGADEQLSCADCGGGYLSFGSFQLGGHGRYDLNDEWTLLGGASYGEYREQGADVTSSLTLASALRFDPAGLGASRPFAEIGVTASPNQQVTYSRTYDDGSSVTRAAAATSSSNYAAYGRIGWIDRVTRVDELGAYAQFTREWQTVKAYAEAMSMSNPFEATVPSGSNSQSVIGLGAQYTHLFGRSIEANLNAGVDHAPGTQSSIDAAVAGYGDVRVTPAHLTWTTVGGRVGRRVGNRVVIDLFVNTVLGPQQIGTGVHGGIDFNIKF
jgi:probable HAF family extracellular repeat protein